MKKLTLTLTLLLSLILNAQISVTKHDGTPILNGDIISYNVATDPGSYLKFYVHNNSTTNAAITKVKFVSATNYDGTGFQLCYGSVCVDNASLVIGQSYPNNGFTIPPGGQNGNFDYLLNTNTGNGVNYPMDLVFKFYTVNSFGAEIGSPINFTYRYDPSLSNASFIKLSELGVQLKNTLVESNLELTTTKNVTLELFDINGKKVYSELLNSGSQSIDLSSLASNIYLLNITNEDNKTETIKIIKK